MVLENNENLLIKVNKNNILHIDPNSVLDNGVIKPRELKQENLTIFVKLDADIQPRTSVLTNENNKLIEISNGILNVTNDDDYNTSWTNVYTNNMTVDNTNQSFGINDINIVNKADLIPTVVINFTDVRGKTLFESPENSPYKCFAHLPYPIFYLTIKGYYGKAVKLKLHLLSFTSKYNNNNGNFEITATFISSTYSYFSDIPLRAIMYAPYMYKTENIVPVKNVNGVVENRIVKSSRGLNMLKSIFNEMKQKKLIDDDVQPTTLLELGKIAESLDKTLDYTITNEIINPELLQNNKQIEEIINEFEKKFNYWKQRYENNLTTELIFGDDTSSLKTQFNIFVKQLNDSLNINRQIKIINIKNIKLKNTLKNYEAYTNASNNTIDFTLIKNDLNDLKASFLNEVNRINLDIEKILNTPSFYKKIFKFKPTIRNIFGIFLANAEVYIRFMKEIHNKAMDVSSIRAKYIQEFDNINKNERIFPWPNIKKKDNKENKINLLYPGSKELITKLKTDSKKLWPEVAFIEEFIGVATNLYDPNTDKEIGLNDLNFSINDNIEYNLTSISKIISSYIDQSYVNKNLVDFAYELWERLYYSINLEDLNDENYLNFIIDGEAENISNIFTFNEYNLSEIKKISSKTEYLSLLERLSKNKILSLNDSVPTTSYIKESLESPFKIEYNVDKKQNYLGSVDSVNKSLKLHKPKDYRVNLFPFSSDTYLNYLNKKSITTSDLSLGDTIKINNINNFIETPNNPVSWVNNENITDTTIIKNNFKNKFKENIKIMNYDFFHKQLLNDFFNFKNYAGSAYIFLNSIPFLDLQDNINFDNTKVLMSSLFKEVGATHNVPYFLILKWGSIYHRYKKYKEENIDILSPVINNGEINLVDDKLLFDNNKEYGYQVFNNNELKEVFYSKRTDVGFHPYYDAVFHQFVNDYTHYNLEAPGYSYGENIKNKVILTKTNTYNLLTNWTSIVNNLALNINDDYYTILPSLNNKNNIINDDFDFIEKNSYRIIWDDTDFKQDSYNLKYPNYNEYHVNNTTTKSFSLNSNYKKIYDLIGTFNHNVLEKFEELFLNFANNLNDSSLKYNNFNSIIKELVTFKTTENNINNIFSNISTYQDEKINNIVDTLLSQNHIINLTLINPKDIDLYIINNIRKGVKIKSNYNNSQLTETNKKLIDLYIGESPTTTNYYYEFFEFFNIEINKTNIQEYKSLILLYAGVKDKNPNLTYQQFINTYIPIIDNQKTFDETLVKILKKIKQIENKTIENDFIIQGIESDNIKLELYNLFKTNNDKWFSNISTGNNLLMEDFLFLDSANKDISDKFFVNLDNFKSLLDSKQNENLNLYTSLSIILRNTNLLIRPMPSYLNFYKKNTSTIENISNSIFGTFMNIDTQDSSPKVLITYTDNASKYPSDMKENDNDNSNYLYDNDGFYIDDHDSPLNSNESNVISFEINIGDINQNIFKSVDLDQSSFQNTSISFKILDDIARSESGSSSKNMDKSLFDIYRNYSYNCTVTMLGNMMIQPTMYFYINNIPMYRGTYLILEVDHSIGKQSTMITTIKGIRMSKENFPLLNNSFVSSYKSLIDRIISNVNVIKQ